MYYLDQFAWDRNGNKIIADASDLQWNGENVVYVKSEATGVIAEFTLKEVVKDAENDIIQWRFFSLDQCLNMVIFNE